MELLNVLLVLLASFSHNVFSYQITGPTSGINAQTGQRPSRKDVRTLQSSGAAWDLYIQALDQFQKQNQASLLSYYSVAGIHGRPYRSWDGVNGNQQSGYCTHGSIIFPTWHRPYLSLVEQILWNNTQTIAKQYPTASRAKYQAAADCFRMPYWDWASSAAIPSALTSSQVTITTPTGSKTIANPLFRYTFNPKTAPPDFPSNEGFSGATTTARSSDATRNLNSNAGSIHDRTYLLISRQSNYNPFSNHAYVDSNGNSYDSLESIHDTIHGLVGGWMGLVPYSAFDPIFWLHHANVDRLFAIWQAIYPNSYITSSQVDQGGTFTNPPGTSENANTALTPFHSNSGSTLFNSNNVRSTRAFGYTVPEVNDWSGNSAQTSASTRAAFKKLYDPNNQFTPRDTSNNLPFPFSKRQSPSDGGISITIPPALKKGSDRLYREWYANIRINKFALPESFYLHFWIGDVPSDASTWLDGGPSFVGTYVVFMDPSMYAPDRTLNIYGQIPLTRKLVELFNAKKIPDLEVPTMTPYLKKNLQWRAQGYDEKEIPLSKLESLRVFVGTSEVKPPVNKDTDFPTYGEFVPEPAVTDGKTGGVPANTDLTNGLPPAAA